MKQEITAGTALFIIGACLLLLPTDRLWRITEKWKTAGGSGPTRGYALLMKILGVVFAGVGCALAVSGL